MNTKAGGFIISELCIKWLNLNHHKSFTVLVGIEHVHIAAQNISNNYKYLKERPELLYVNSFLKFVYRYWIFFHYKCMSSDRQRLSNFFGN